MLLQQIQQTIQKGNVREVKKLLDSGRLSANDIVCPEANISALSYALWFRHEEIAHLLLTRNANIHQRDTDKWTALHYASRFIIPTVVERLLELKSDVNAKTEFFRSAVTLGINAAANDREGAMGVIEMLLVAGADPSLIRTCSGFDDIGTLEKAMKLCCN